MNRNIWRNDDFGDTVIEYISFVFVQTEEKFTFIPGDQRSTVKLDINFRRIKGIQSASVNFISN